MSAETIQLKGAKPPAGEPAADGNGLTGLGFIVTLGITALIAWLAGVALNRGFGVHVPFVASFILLAAGLQVVKLAAIEVAHSWHTEAAKVVPTAAAAAVKASLEATRKYENE